MVLVSRPLNKLRLAFIGYLTAMFIWSISALIIVAEFGDPVIWFRILVASSIVMMLSLFYFVQIFFAQRRKWTIFVFWYGILAIFISLFSNLAVRSAFVEDGFLVYEFHNFIAVIAGPGYGLFIFSLFELVRGYRVAGSELQRTRLRYLITALSLVLLGTMVNWTEYGKYPADIAVNGFAAILIAFAILRYSLLDIRFVFRTGLLYSIITFVTGALYYLIISFTLKFLESYTGLQVFALAIIVALLSSLLLSPLRNRVQAWVDRLFYREKYDAGLMLQRLSETTASLMDLEKTAEIILSEIIETMQLEHALVYVRYEREDVFKIISNVGLSDQVIREYENNHPVVEWFSSDHRTLSKHQLNIEPTFKSLWSSEVNSIEDQNIELFVPIKDENELVGFFTIGPKRSGQGFTLEDQRTLITLANQTALSVKNARLYDELQDTFVQTIVTLANAIDIRDSYTSDHSQRIAKLAVETAKVMGCDMRASKRYIGAALLHDIGKIGIPKFGPA